MARLTDLKPQIDQGVQAQLVLLHPVNLPYPHGIVQIRNGVRILVSRAPEGYNWKLDYVIEAPPGEYSYAAKHDWNFGPDWSTFLKRIEGVQTTSDQWELLPQET